jgi:radical SAM superfamily enzyme YgiQ (UPF0313 family)
MKILMLNPPFLSRFSRSQRSPAVTKGGTLYYPFWLAYATGVLEEKGHEVRLVDAPAQGLDLKGTIEYARDFKPKLVVLDTSTPSIYNDVKVGELIKQTLPESFMVLVGTHPSALPEETLKLSNKIDAVARGEYDYTILELAESLEDNSSLDSVDGLSFRSGEDITHNKERSLIEDVDKLPFLSRVYRRHLNVKNYYFAAADYPVIQIVTARGCPNRCFFCLYPQTFHSRKFRPRSAENVVEEFSYIKDNFPQVKEIGFEDDTFTISRKRAREISKILIESNNRQKWYTNVRPDLDFETMALMKEAGCRLVTVGFESASQKVLDGMHKGLKLEQSIEFMRYAKKLGILVHGCIMVGNPGETRKTMEESFNFARKLACDSMQFYPLIVYPGTEAYEWAKAHGYLLTEDFSQWLTPTNAHNCVISFPHLTREEMVDFCERAYNRYHFNFKYLAGKLLQMIVCPSEGRRTIRSALKYLAYLRR